MTEFNLEARWVPFAERVPAAEKVVLAQKIGGKNVGSIYVEYDEYCPDPPWVFNCVFFMRKDDLRNWEWLEVREKGGEND